jgi:S-adenosylmethionine hydrolase
MNHRSVLHSIRSRTQSGTIALLTDFGLQDQYVAAMKGVILSINPRAHIIDISHQVKPQCTRQAAYLLWSTYRFFPRWTVFLNVVDPGVGGDRPIIVAKTKEFVFLAPDNGLLDFVLSEAKIIQTVEVSLPKVQKYLSKEVSPTFHGRDIFAPLAAHVSKGVLIGKLGPQRKPSAVASAFIHSKLETQPPCILNIDLFGNVITNLVLKDAEQGMREIEALSVGGNLVSRWIRFYDEAPPKTPCLVIGGSGLVEISVKNASAARLLNAGFDTPLKIYWR